MRPQLNQAPKPHCGLAALLAGLLLAFSLAARCDAVHAWVHADRAAGTPGCVLCLLVQAQVSAAETHVAALAVSFPPVDFSPVKAAPWLRLAFVLPPGRAPPAPSSVS